MKTILLAVSGLSPQVITETLYALYKSQRQIDAVHVITTRDGKEKIFAQLLNGPGDHYHRFLAEYGIDPASIDFNSQNVHVVTDENGMELPDIVTESDNEHLLKACLELTFRFTRDPDTTVFFSIAGGRKTMSSCLTLAAQLYGRPRDRIYHVLVSPEFESSRDFYYPPKESRLIELKDKQGGRFSRETSYAEVNLIHVPFVSIREYLSAEMLKSPKDPGTLMLSLVREKPTRLIVNLKERKIVYKNLELDLRPTWMALYAFFADRKKNCTKTTQSHDDCRECYLDSTELEKNRDRIRNIYISICGTRPIEEMKAGGIIALDHENFKAYRSKIKKEIIKIFGSGTLKKLEIAAIGKRPDTRYGLRMDKDKIEIIS